MERQIASSHINGGIKTFVRCSKDEIDVALRWDMCMELLEEAYMMKFVLLLSTLHDWDYFKNKKIIMAKPWSDVMLTFITFHHTLQRL